MTEYAVILLTPFDFEIIKQPASELVLEELQELVGGYIEPVPTPILHDISPDLLMIVDEEGKFREMNVMNPLASLLYGNPSDCIVGRAVIVTRFNEDPEADPDIYALPLEVAQSVASRLRKFEQALGY